MTKWPELWGVLWSPKSSTSQDQINVQFYVDGLWYTLQQRGHIGGWIFEAMQGKETTEYWPEDFDFRCSINRGYIYI